MDPGATTSQLCGLRQIISPPEPPSHVNRCEDADLRAVGQEALAREMELYVRKGLPCTHSDKQALRIASTGVRVGTQVPQLKAILFIYFLKEKQII